MKQTIKVRFTDWLEDQKLVNGATFDNFIIKALQKYYNVIISDDPEFVFFGNWGRGYDFLKYDCIRVFCCFEEIIPDFNVCDYAITICKSIEYEDRIFSDAVIVMTEQFKKSYDMAQQKHIFSYEQLQNKKYFCSYVQSSVLSTNDYREAFFKELSKYKKVNAGGHHLNNIGGPIANKLEFEAKHKFSISFHNACNYTLQDRPIDAFAAQAIPIFWGNPAANKIFNSKAYINCHEYTSFEAVIQRIKEVDNDDELYMTMMKEPAFLNFDTSENVQKRFEDYLINVIENGTKCTFGGLHNEREKEKTYYGQRYLFRKYKFRGSIAKCMKIMAYPFRKTKLAEKVKRKLLRY